MFTAKSPVEFVHPEFGVLSLDSGLWSGKVQRDGRDIRFCIAGTSTAPDDGLLGQLRDLLGRFAEVERAAMDFLRMQAPALRSREFTFYSIDFLWEEKPDAFAMEFRLAGDEYGIWRVEFDRGQPKSVGRDD